MLQDAPLYAYLPAKDLARARRFYEQVLGLEPDQEINGGVAYRFAGGTAAFLYPTPNAGTSQASQAFWDVADLEREVSDLVRRGVRFERYEGLPAPQDAQGIMTAGGAKAAWFKDSEGNTLALIQTLQRAPSR
jgi:catechol 2,3-dioxygenase-like lactoylglutathione lyase family enzyme